MTRSLPGERTGQWSARRDRWAKRLQGTATNVGLKATPGIPTRVKRLMAGGRSVTIDGNTLDPTLQLTLAAQRAMGINGLAIDGDVETSRANMRETIGALPVRDIHVATTDISIPGPGGPLAVRHYRPDGDEAKPLLIYLHGGGWVLGDLDVYDAVCRLTCRDGDVGVLAVDYRLAPEHPAPAAVDDAYAAYLWAHSHAEELGAMPGRVAVGGDSAGANMATVVAMSARDRGDPAPVLQWLVYPVVDCTAQTRSRTLFADGFLLTKHDMDWFTDQYVGLSDLEPTDPRVSPLLAADLSGLPPALVAVAGFDPLRDEGERYAAALRAAGNIVDLRIMRSVIHGFMSLSPLGGDSAVATTELISALRAHLTRG